MSNHRSPLSAPLPVIGERIRALDYVALLKPWIVLLVLVSTLGGIFLGKGGLPEASLIITALVGVGLATAAAACLNNYIDADIDAIMKRTSKRPTASGVIDRRQALIIGLALSLLSVFVMAIGTNPIASSLCFASIVIYVLPYTYCTKRITPLATFIGGVAGALPPVIGYAVTQPFLDARAVALFMILYAWQHPHFWALALKYRGEYAKANVQNLPVARGVDETKKQIAVWAFILMLVSTLPYVLGMAGTLYLSVATLTGLLFFSMSIWFILSEREVAMSLFFFSIVHLPTLFCVMVVDFI